MVNSFDVETTGDGLIEVLIEVKRVSKVIKGGRTFSFSALVVVGDGSGKVGIGLGKARELPSAIRKAMENGRQNMFKVAFKGTTLLYPIQASYGASKVLMLPAKEGTGIIAGRAMRAIFKALGIEDIVAKCIGSTNPLNVLRATVSGLKGMVSPDYIAKKRGKTLAQLYTDVAAPVSEHADQS